MVRMRLLALLVLSLTMVAHAADSKPPWQRLLTGDDAKKAAGLQQRVEELEAADKYAEAIRLQEELIALRTKVQGADHWETVDSKWDLTALKAIAALPVEKRAGLGQAARRVAEAESLEQKAQYEKALPLRQERLEWCRQVLGEDHPITAAGYTSIAQNLDAQGKYAEAGPMCRKALDIYRKTLGEEHPNTAAGYNNVAAILNAQGQYAEAGPLYQKALDICRKVRGEDHAETAANYNNIAQNLDAQGKYAEAGPMCRKALDIYRKTLGEEHLDTATSYDNVASNLESRGQQAEAGPLYQKALDIRRTALGENHPETAASYYYLASNLKSLGQYAKAGSLGQKALDIRREALGENHPDTAASYNNIAINLNAQSKYAEARPLLQKALDIYRKTLGEYHPVTAAGYNSVAVNLDNEGKYAEAAVLLQKALGIRRTALGENHPFTAASYNNVAINLSARGEYRAALASLEAAARSYEAARLGVAAAGLERAAYGAERSPYAFLAAARNRTGRSADAWSALEANLARGLLDEMALQRGAGLTPDERRRRDDLRSRRKPLEARVLTLVRRPERTAGEDAELKRLLEQRRELEQFLSDLAVAVSRREVAALDQLQTALPADAAFLVWVDVSDKFGGVHEHWGCVVRAKGDPRWEPLPGSDGDGKWTPEDNRLPVRFREVLTKAAPAEEIDALARKLHAQRLAPLEQHLAGVKRLFVAPVSQMAGIPVEVLTDQYTVSYTPSGTYLARLKGRERSRNTRLLAVGDPLFPAAKTIRPPTELPPGGLLITQVLPDGNAANARLQAGDVLVSYAGEELTSAEQLGKLIAAKAKEKSILVRVWREGQEKLAERELAPGRLGVALAKGPAREAITARRQADQMLAQLSRGEDFAELPGTQVEITRLAGLFDAKSVTTLTRADASEQRLDQLRTTDALKQFRYLHFATHGKANNVRAFDSALILTRPTNAPEPRVGEPYLDGRLTASEVLEYWKLDAELVTLSACESGLGRQGGGDGLLGFAQAFLLAGSRSVCLTLWQVDDTATALLMDRFYRNLLGKREDGAKRMGKAAALHEAKQWLRNVPASEALQRLGEITNGIVRGERPAREEMRAVPRPKDPAGDYKPYTHPRYWAAFILIGDPE